MNKNFKAKIEKLKEVTDLNIFYDLSKKRDDIIIYKEFMAVNLEYNINQICRKNENNAIENISYIEFPFRNMNIEFSIEILNQKYNGSYTIWCPELRGCITEGKTKKEAFNKILFAISEILILNYDLFKINPLTYPFTPLPTNKFVHFNKYFLEPINFFSPPIKKIIIENKINKAFIGINHLIFKRYNNDKLNISFPFNGINDFTKYCIDNIIEHENPNIQL